MFGFCARIGLGRGTRPPRHGRLRDGRDPEPHRAGRATAIEDRQRGADARRTPIAAAGVARLVSSVGRRLVGGRVALGVEYDLRKMLYEKFLALDLGFFDGQQRGRSTSRATVDHRQLRFFLGYRAAFLIESLLTIFFAAIQMFSVDAALAAISLAPVPFVVIIADATASGRDRLSRKSSRDRRAHRGRRRRSPRTGHQGVRARRPAGAKCSGARRRASSTRR